MRILCVIAAMRAGGAERVMSRLLTHLASKHSLELVTWEAADVRPFYHVPPSVCLVQRDLLGGRGLVRLWRVMARVPTLRREVRSFDADVVLSFINTTNLTTIIACYRSGVGIVVSERTDPAMHSGGWAVNIARRILYPLANRTVVPTSRVAAHFGISAGNRISVIGNPIEQADLRAVPAMPGPGERFRLIGVGRLDAHKQFDHLIKAFARVADRLPSWDLVIFGEGPELEELARLAADLGVQNRVSLAGITTSLERELAISHVFVIPSAYEGFPNALGEAMATGLPAIGYDCVSGVEDLILDGKTGYLVGSQRQIASLDVALERIMTDADLRTEMGAAAAARADFWRPSQVIPEWESVLKAAAAEVGKSA